MFSTYSNITRRTRARTREHYSVRHIRVGFHSSACALIPLIAQGGAGSFSLWLASYRPNSHTIIYVFARGFKGLRIDVHTRTRKPHCIERARIARDCVGKIFAVAVFVFAAFHVLDDVRQRAARRPTPPTEVRQIQCSLSCCRRRRRW